MAKTALKDSALDTKSVIRCKNMFALGITYWLFDRSMDQTLDFIAGKFKKNPVLVEANHLRPSGPIGQCAELPK